MKVKGGRDRTGWRDWRHALCWAGGGKELWWKSAESFDPTPQMPQVKSQSSLEDDMSGRKVLAIADEREESMRPSDAIDCQSRLKGDTYSR